MTEDVAVEDVAAEVGGSKGQEQPRAETEVDTTKVAGRRGFRPAQRPNAWWLTERETEAADQMRGSRLAGRPIFISAKDGTDSEQSD